MELRYVENDGMAFSMLSGRQTLLIVVTGITLAALVWYLFSKGRRRAPSVAVCLIIAGGLGNLIDRVTAGRVIDFFATTFIDFAVFNVARLFVVIRRCPVGTGCGRAQKKRGRPMAVRISGRGNRTPGTEQMQC